MDREAPTHGLQIAREDGLRPKSIDSVSASPILPRRRGRLPSDIRGPPMGANCIGRPPDLVFCCQRPHDALPTTGPSGPVLSTPSRRSHPAPHCFQSLGIWMAHCICWNVGVASLSSSGLPQATLRKELHGDPFAYPNYHLATFRFPPLTVGIPMTVFLLGFV